MGSKNGNSTGSVMVVGGGVAGIQAALDLANSGFYVHLVEKSPAIGGMMSQLDKTFPTNDCSMCILSPKLVEVGRHPNVNLLTCAQLVDLGGEPGRFVATVQQAARYVDLDKCISCGVCTEKCPERVSDTYNAGLAERTAIYKLYPQAIPSGYVIDSKHCRQLGKGKKCGVCAKVCPADAVNYEDKERTLNLEVGSVILSAGSSTFDPSRIDTYAYVDSPNVVTSLEFERLLSASGPTAGHLERPSDTALRDEMETQEKELSKISKQLKQLEEKATQAEEVDARRMESLKEKSTALEGKIAQLKQAVENIHEPKRIAWLQCVGSRDIHHCANGYCSNVCCMYAIKEAIVAKEHCSGALDTAVFFMDMRTHGKDFEKYYKRAQSEYGVRFIRSRIHTIDPIPETNGLSIGYATEGGTMAAEDFDMVVLSVGLEIDPDSVALAQKLGIELNKYNFAMTGGSSPVSTSRPGVYTCGLFQGPKDIPYSVMEASAAACAAAGDLSEARGSQVQVRELPPEQDLADEEPRIGVFVCNCGINIGSVVDVKEVTRYAATLPHVVYTNENLFSCSQDTQERIRNVIKEQKLNRVVVAACSPRTHEPLFQETLRVCGVNKYLFEMANIRDQDSWVHQKDPYKATDKARDLVRMAVARASLLKPLTERPLTVTERALVIGGGVAGLNAALSIARQGFEAVLVEREKELGGVARRVQHTIEGMDVQTYLDRLLDEVRSNAKIQVLTEAEVVDFKGYKGNFTTEVRTGAGATPLKIDHGVTIVATGAMEYQPKEYLYGQHERVMTQLELGAFVHDKADEVSKWDRVIMVQCVGSRNDEYPNCSRICCQGAVKHALELKKLNPSMDVVILYRDMRTYGVLEEYYTEARRQGVLFVRFNEAHPPEVTGNGNGLSILYKDHVLTRMVSMDADAVVLSAGTRAADTEKLASQLKVPRNADGFFIEAHAKLRPVDFSSEGIFLCGTAHGPKLLSESISQAMAAASRAGVFLASKDQTIGGVVAHVEESLCAACLVCVRNCPYGVPQIENDVSVINEALCQGCGICVSECPARAIHMHHYEDDQIMSKVEALLEGVI